MQRILILAAASALTSVAFTPITNNPVSERLQVGWLEHQWTQAAVTGDRPVLNDLLDDKFFEVFPGDIRRSKRDETGSI